MRIGQTSAWRAAALVSLGAAFPVEANALGYGKYSGSSGATTVFFETLTFPAGTHSVSANVVSTGGDTVLHVMRRNGFGEWSYFTGNDDCNGSTSSCTTFSLAADEQLRVVVHAYSTSTTGTCDVLIDGSVRWPNRYFGGVRVAVTGGWDVGATVQTALAPQPAGSDDTVILVLHQLVDRAIGFDDDSGVNLASKVILREAADDFASKWIVVGSYSPLKAQGGGYMFVINDAAIAGRDADGDELGTQLEASLLTDSNKADTDDDGINDGAEILGVQTADSPGSLHFHRYWADPRRRDLFFEADLAQPPGGGRPANPVTPAVAQLIHEAYADTDSTHMNPDGSKGFFIHIDAGTGLVTCSAQEPYVGCWGHGGTYIPEGDPCVRRNTNMPTARRGFFRYLYLYPGVGTGGSTIVKNPVGSMSDANGSNEGYAEDIIHEVGHMLGLAHHGPQLTDDLEAGAGGWSVRTWRFNYKSLMSYVYQDTRRFSNGSRQSISPHTVYETSSRPLAEFTYLTQTFWDVSSTGSGVTYVDYNRDGVFDGSTVRAPYLACPIDGGPRGAACGQTKARGSVVCRNATDCATWPSCNEDVANLSTTTDAPTLAAHAGFLYLLNRGTDSPAKIWVQRTADLSGCSTTNYELPCASWSDDSTPGYEASTSPGAAEVGQDGSGNPKLHIVYRDAASSTLKWATSVLVSGQDQWTDRGTLAGTNASALRPMLIKTSTIGVGKDMLLAYRGADGNLWESWYTVATDTWSTPTQSLMSGGGVIAITTAPAAALTPPPPFYTDDQLRVAVALSAGDTTNDDIHILKFVVATGRWADDAGTDWVPAGAAPPPPAPGSGRSKTNKPMALAYSNGRLYLYFIDPNGTTGAKLNMQRYKTGYGYVWGFETAFNSNANWQGQRVAGIPTRGLSAVKFGSRIWMAQDGDAVDATLCPINGFNNRILYYPFADGVEERQYADFNDWSWMRDQMVPTNTITCR